MVDLFTRLITRHPGMTFDELRALTTYARATPGVTLAELEALLAPMRAAARPPAPAKCDAAPPPPVVLRLCVRRRQ